MNKDMNIFVAGHNGMVGSAVMRALNGRGYAMLIGQGSAMLDLRNQAQVASFFSGKWRLEYVFFCAGKVAGIKANSERPAEFLYDNMMMAANVIHQSYLHKVKKLCFFGSSCIYPRDCPQPIKEEYIFTGPLEPTNEGYAVAKLAGYRMAYNYAKQYGMNTISIMPCNLYGTNDHYDLERAHVLSSLVKRFVDAEREARPSVTLWGTGSAMREFLHVDDLARAAIMLMDTYDDPGIINVGSGKEISIRELAYKIKDATGFKGTIGWDSSMPDGMPRKCMDVSKIRALGFKPEISLDDGIRRTVEEYRKL